MLQGFFFVLLYLHKMRYGSVNIRVKILTVINP